jgi:TM2 domain-containing membrane protein YozV
MSDRFAPSTPAPLGYAADRRQVNKVLYVLMSFFFGGIGVHRFLRGQVGIGIVMILVAWLTLGIWPLVDFIIGLTKLSVYRGDDFVFTPDGRWAR